MKDEWSRVEGKGQEAVVRQKLPKGGKIRNGTIRRLRKTAVAGRNGLAKPLLGKKIAVNRPTFTMNVHPQMGNPG
jgi:hypothetical protein